MQWLTAVMDGLTDYKLPVRKAAKSALDWFKGNA